MSRQLEHESYCGSLQIKALMEALVTSCSLQLRRADEHHRDTEETAAFDDDDAGFRRDLKSSCALKEIFTIISLCVSMSQWQK